MVRPVPIPNTAVKRSLADGSGCIASARVGCRQIFQEKRPEQHPLFRPFFFVLMQTNRLAAQPRGSRGKSRERAAKLAAVPAKTTISLWGQEGPVKAVQDGRLRYHKGSKRSGGYYFALYKLSQRFHNSTKHYLARLVPARFPSGTAGKTHVWRHILRHCPVLAPTPLQDLSSVASRQCPARRPSRRSSPIRKCRQSEYKR